MSEQKSGSPVWHLPVNIKVAPEVHALYDPAHDAPEGSVNTFFKPSTPNSAAIDLRASVWGEIGPGRTFAVATGIFMEICDPNWAAFLLPRSGLALNRRVTLGNAPGLIDPDYRGEIKLIIRNEDPDNVFKWEQGERLAQLMFVPFGRPVINFVEELGNSVRGIGGFGSTGTR